MPRMQAVLQENLRVRDREKTKNAGLRDFETWQKKMRFRELAVFSQDLYFLRDHSLPLFELEIGPEVLATELYACIHEK